MRKVGKLCAVLISRLLLVLQCILCVSTMICLAVGQIVQIHPFLQQAVSNKAKLRHFVVNQHRSSSVVSVVVTVVPLFKTFLSACRKVCPTPRWWCNVAAPGHRYVYSVYLWVFFAFVDHMTQKTKRQKTPFNFYARRNRRCICVCVTKLRSQEQ